MSIYKFNFRTPSGEIIPFESLKGKVLLIVNTATKCGLAPQFIDLEALHKKYKDSGLVVIGFPCAQFLNQEPETNESMVSVCQLNFGVTFQLTQKIDVNGKDTDPVFEYLKNSLPGMPGNDIKWNFTKFLIDSSGEPFKRYAPTTLPNEIESDIINLLKK